MRPAIKSGLLPVWRDRDTVQIGIDSRRAVALSGMGRAAFLIGLLDGSRDRGQVIAAAAAHGVSAGATERILTLLAAGGALDDFPAGTLRALPETLRTRLAPELATASLAYGDGEGGARFLARRRASLVWIDGERRVARAIARILSTAGVGTIKVGSAYDEPAPPGSPPPGQASSGPAPPGPAPRGQASSGPVPPGPPPPGQASSGPVPPRPAPRGPVPPGSPPRGQAPRGPASLDGRARRPDLHAPGRYLGAARRPDLVVLVGQPRRGIGDRLVGDRQPHLAVLASEAIGIVGPLVVPGQTACLRCLDYVRAANDPCWPLILAQLVRRRAEPPACDAVLATAVAAQAAAQALTAIDKAPTACAAVNGTLELVLPDWRWRRRTWPAHPACPCASSP